MFSCKKCPYFVKVDNKLQRGVVIVGFCKLRQKKISDRSINMQYCKDRAIIE